MKNVKITVYWSGKFDAPIAPSDVETIFLDENGSPVEDGENAKTVRVQVKDFPQHLETQKLVSVNAKKPLVFNLKKDD